MGVIQNAIASHLASIKNARFGSDVRDSIHKAIDAVAGECDSQLASINTNISKAISDATLGAASAREAATLAAQAKSEVNDTLLEMRDAVHAATDFKEASATETDYVQQSSGAWVGKTPTLKWKGTDGNWEYTFTHAPRFTNLSVSRTPYSRVNTDDTVTYNPNTGNLHINLIEPLSRLRVITNDAPYAESKPLNSYSYVDGVPELKIWIPRGTPGKGVEAIDHRPFILSDLYVSPVDAFNHGKWFESQSLVNRDAIIDSDSGKVTVRGANEFDAVLITLRKTVENTSSFTLLNNYGGSAKDNKKNFLANNTDFDSSVTVFLRKPIASIGEKRTSVTAAFVDNQGRLLTRRIHWLAEDHHLVVSGGAKKAYPDRRFVADTDYTSSLGTQVGDAYTGAFLFENAKLGKDGDRSEWVKTSSGYSNQSYWDKGYNPTTNIAMNKRYNQALIPMRIIGISFSKTTDDVERYF